MYRLKCNNHYRHGYEIEKNVYGLIAEKTKGKRLQLTK